MILRQARESDFAHLETFVWQAIFPAFDQPGLTDAQRAENDAMVERARTVVISSLGQETHGVFVALDPKSKTLAGYIIADASPRAYAEIVQLIVKRAFWGKGVAGELLDLATDFIGRDRAVSLSVRHYNERALAFFAKHDFHNTGETAGNHAIPRSLLLREAYEEVVPPVSSKPAAREVDDAWLDFPTASDEPVFEPLPDYNLSIEDEPLFETGVNSLKVEDPDSFIPEESSLTDAQLTELEAFIARARAKKGRPAEVEGRVAPSPERPTSAPKQVPKAAPSSTRKENKPANKHPEVVFEIDYGERNSPQSESTATRSADRKNSAPTEKKSIPIAEPSFEFAFSGSAPQKTEDRPTSSTSTAATQRSTAKPRAEEKPASAPEKKPAHKHCPDCDSRIPAAARFCFSCGYPQPDEESIKTPAAGQAPEEEVLELDELPITNTRPKADTSAFTARPEPKESKSAPAETITPSADKKLKKTVTPAELKQAFRNHLQDRILAYFGERKLKKYLSLLEENTAFQQVRDGSLTNLATWLNERQPSRATRNRRRDVLADLAEYFIVETAAELSNHVLPQRLLRYQSIDWDTVDLFRLVMDYLDFDSESEQVYTDFVAMPTRALKNASRSFLRAAKDERIFFICDQSLISSAKNGFAVTDSGIYWKNVLQPAGAATFTTLKETRLDQGHVIIDGQFFDAGNRLNLKVAILLDKLRRMS